MNYEITGDIKTLGGQIDRIQHFSAVLTVDMIVYIHKVVKFRKNVLYVIGYYICLNLLPHTGLILLDKGELLTFCVLFMPFSIYISYDFIGFV